jgi:hypothetical protein
MGPPLLCTEVARQLESTFELTSLGPVCHLLGIEVVIDPSTRNVVFTQRQYIKDLLVRFHMMECNGCKTPEATTPIAVQDVNPGDYLPYRELTGALQYLVSGSRPDIAHAVRNLGRFLGCYDASHYAMAKRVLRYLKSTIELGLHMEVNPESILKMDVYCDADYANDVDDRLSVSGYVALINGNVISYGSRKQAINAQSTSEAEYVAMSEGVREILWLVGLCRELQWKFDTPVLHGDNKGAIFMTAKPGKHSRAKHIQNKYHLVRHLRERGEITTVFCSTDQMIADIFTKPLARPKFEQFRDMMKVLPVGSTRHV